MRKIVISGMVAVAAVLGSVIPAVAAGAAAVPASVSVTHAASPAGSGASTEAIPVSSLSDRISCASPTACLAVGYTADSSGNTAIATAESLHGTAWKNVTVKEPKGTLFAALSGVSCKTATYCLAVGAYQNKAGNTEPAAWTWNGTALTLVAAPSMPSGSSLTDLSAVTCVAVKSCVAIGSGFGSTGNTLQLIWTWNGKAWTRKTPSLPGKVAGADLSAAHCFTLTSCVVAGTVDTVSGTKVTEKLLLATWNGKTFTEQKPGPVALGLGIITDLSCFSPSHCAMVGSNVTLSGQTTVLTALAEVWNGRTWTATKWTGPKGSTTAILYGVSCPSETSCVATGTAGTEKVMHAAALSFNGTKWSVLKVPSVGAGLLSLLGGVSCPKTADCMAIGEYAKPGAVTAKRLAGYWNGSAWKLKAA